nr:hypothetical protein BgiMline_022876 [Biomphalaria glabrata]
MFQYLMLNTSRDNLGTKSNVGQCPQTSTCCPPWTVSTDLHLLSSMDSVHRPPPAVLLGQCPQTSTCCPPWTVSTDLHLLSSMDSVHRPPPLSSMDSVLRPPPAVL